MAGPRYLVELSSFLSLQVLYQKGQGIQLFLFLVQLSGTTSISR